MEQINDIRYSEEIDWTKMEELWEKYQKEYGVKERSQEVPEKINKETRVSDFMESMKQRKISRLMCADRPHMI